MISYRFFKTNLSHLNAYRRFIHLNAMNMKKAYVRYLEGAEDFQLSFHLTHETSGKSRQFNFSRKLSETVNHLVNRVQSNVDNYVKNRKKKPKKQENGPESIPPPSETTVALLLDGTPVACDSICKDVIFGSGNLSLQVCGIDYMVTINDPWVNTITLPSSMMVGFQISPSKFESLFTVKTDSHFTWYKGMLGKSNTHWNEVGQGYFYTPTVDDIGHHLKVVCVPGDNDRKGEPVEAVSKNCVEAGPGACPFEVRHSFTKERCEWPVFRVMSYNILADLYADSDVARKELFPHCPPYALQIDYRKQLILKEILGYHADLMCLQEVDSKVFTGDLDPLLSYEGYKGLFEKKGGSVCEGLACFYHQSKFRLLDSHCICLATELDKRGVFAELWNEIQGNKPFVTRFKERTTTVQVTVLECIHNPKRIVVVGNTHLYFHPDADHIRLLQAAMVLLHIQDVINRLSTERPEKMISTIICGDFNSTPECGVYQLMTTQFIPTDHQDWNSNTDEAVKGVSVSHGLPLESAYGTPKYTNFTVGFSGCLDYIFYQNDKFSVSQVVPLPSEDELRQHIALPNVVFPSDHIALVADLVHVNQ